MVVPADYSSKNVLQKSSLGRGGKRIGSLASHLGIFDDEFGGILAAGNLNKFQYWYKNMGMCVQTHRYHSITQIYFDEALAPLQLSHLPRHHIIRGNTRPDWVFRPTCYWVEISRGEKI